jgi:hypothetical protein
VLDATVGYDPADPTTQASGGRIPRSYTTSLKDGALSAARLGVLTEFFGSAPEDQEVAPSITGIVALTEAEVSDLRAGKFYLAVLSQRSPRLGARAEIAFPA